MFILCGWSCLRWVASRTKCFMPYHCAHRGVLSVSGTKGKAQLTRVQLCCLLALAHSASGCCLLH